MELQFYTPQNDLLKPYIEGYYFLSDLRTGVEQTYLTFPNNYCIVTINLNSKVTLDRNRISVEPSNANNIYASFVYRYINPIKVYYKSPFQEITIYFKALGINYFVNNLEAMYSLKKMTEFVPQFSDFKKEMNKIFHLDQRDMQIANLEAYWLSKMMEKDLDLMHAILLDIESNMKIEDIAQKHHLSRKHLNHLIQKNLGKSAVEYRKIFRFRNAINKSQGTTLTELSYESCFFDQSHLIKDFKSLTDTNPNRFFKDVNTTDKNVWLFT